MSRKAAAPALGAARYRLRLPARPTRSSAFLKSKGRQDSDIDEKYTPFGHSAIRRS
jgi:hypothetical protein